MLSGSTKSNLKFLEHVANVSNVSKPAASALYMATWHFASKPVICLSIPFSKPKTVNISFQIVLSSPRTHSFDLYLILFYNFFYFLSHFVYLNKINVVCCFPPEDESPVSVMIEHNNNNFMLCTLQHGRIFQQALDLNFNEGEEVTLYLKGKGVIYTNSTCSTDFAFEFQ